MCIISHCIGHNPFIVHVYVGIHLCNSMWSSLAEANLYRFSSIICAYKYCHWRFGYQEGRIGDPVIKSGELKIQLSRGEN